MNSTEEVNTSAEYVFDRPEGSAGPFNIFADISVVNGEAVFMGGCNIQIRELSRLKEGQRALFRVSISPDGNKGIIHIQTGMLQP